MKNDNDENAPENHPNAAPANVETKGEAESLEAELVALNDRYLRLAADFDNYRKRTIRDSEQRAAAQKETFIRELLPFDPHRHEAVQAQFDPEQPDHVVIEVVQRGYRHGVDVIRPARVIINDLSLADTGNQAG